MKLYLAGPEVFLPDAAAVGARKLALCREHGFTGLFPGAAGGPVSDPAALYDGCRAMMDAADAAIANLTPFRGAGADPGTAFEVGYLIAQGKPVLGYSNVAASLEARVRAQAAGRLVPTPDGGWRDPDGLAVEPFGLAENLMLACATRAPIVVVDAAPADRFRDLAGFAQCLALARDLFRRDAQPGAKPASGPS